MCVLTHFKLKERNMIKALEELMGLAWYTFKIFAITTIIIWFAIFAFASSAKADEVNPPVKMSKSEICHPTDSSYYTRTKNFTGYETLKQCLQDGGRLPKNYEPTTTTTGA